MRRIITIAALAASVIVAVPGPASAGKPSNGCPNANSGWVLVDRDGWLARTLDGMAQEGIDTPPERDAFAVAFGFADWAAFSAWIVGEQWERFNHNGNAFVCIKDLPNTRGLPGYVFGGVDDQSSSKG